MKEEARQAVLAMVDRGSRLTSVRKSKEKRRKAVHAVPETVVLDIIVTRQ